MRAQRGGSVGQLFLFLAVISIGSRSTPAVTDDKTDGPIGSDFSAWREQGEWKVVKDALVNSKDETKLDSNAGMGEIMNGPNGNTVDLYTKKEYGDVDAHVEFMIPKGSNSGVYFMGRYEIQIFDSFGVTEPKHSDCGGIYQRWDPARGEGKEGYEGHPPLVNAAKKPGRWQILNVKFRAPQFDANGKKTANAVFEKVVLNGLTIHENVELKGPTRGPNQDERATGPLVLQGDHGPVAFRNIVITPRDAETGGLTVTGSIQPESAQPVESSGGGYQLSTIQISPAEPQAVGGGSGLPAREKFEESGFVPLFDGKTLNGWHVSAQTGHSHTSGNKSGGRWVVEDGAITGSQDVPGNGGIVVSDKEFGDCEIALEMKNDFGPDSGIFLRSTENGIAYQVHVDYHVDGTLAGVYGEGFSTPLRIRNFKFLDSPEKIVPEDAPAVVGIKDESKKPSSDEYPLPVKPADWPAFWKHGQWNEMRARITGNPPTITTWINGVRFVQYTDHSGEGGKPRHPAAGHIALQVHGGGDYTKQFVRYRNIRVKPLDGAKNK